jgi:hypothetical protein
MRLQAAGAVGVYDGIDAIGAGAARLPGPARALVEFGHALSSLLQHSSQGLASRGGH